MRKVDRLNQRFKAIQGSLKELYGDNRSFAAASAAWLMAVQYMQKQAILNVLRSIQDPRKGTYFTVEELETEIEHVLQGFHAELCEHLGVPQEDAWELARSFKQVIDDVCSYKGE